MGNKIVESIEESRATFDQLSGAGVDIGINCISFEDWDETQLIKWVKEMKFEDKSRSRIFLEIIISEECITGEYLNTAKKSKFQKRIQKATQLIKDKEEQFKDFKFDKTIDIFFKCVEHIRKKKKRVYDDPNWYTVFFKLLKFHQSAKYCLKTADILSDKKEFYFRYFLPFVKIVNWILEYSELQDKFKKKKMSRKNLNRNNLRIKEEIECFIEKYELKTDGMNMFEENSFGEHFFYYLSKIPKEILPEKYHKSREELGCCAFAYGETGVKMRVKLVLTEIYGENQQKERDIRKFLSPILQRIPSKIQQKFGFFHCALIVGPFYLDWQNNEYVIPKQFLSSKVLCALDMREMFNLSDIECNIEEIIRKIVDVVFHWNNNLYYDRLNSNCQHFTLELLEKLDVNLKTKKLAPVISRFFKTLRFEGKSSVSFQPCKEFLQYYKFNDWTEKEFKTHSELDLFVIAIKENGSNENDEIEKMKMKFLGEYIFLKAIDRAFWLKFTTTMKIEFAPYDQQDSNSFITKCPFGDPRISGSIPPTEDAFHEILQNMNDKKQNESGKSRFVESMCEIDEN